MSPIGSGTGPIPTSPPRSAAVAPTVRPAPAAQAALSAPVGQALSAAPAAEVFRDPRASQQLLATQSETAAAITGPLVAGDGFLREPRFDKRAWSRGESATPSASADAYEKSSPAPPAGLSPELSQLLERRQQLRDQLLQFQTGEHPQLTQLDARRQEQLDAHRSQTQQRLKELDQNESQVRARYDQQVKDGKSAWLAAPQKLAQLEAQNPVLYRDLSHFERRRAALADLHRQFPNQPHSAVEREVESLRADLKNKHQIEGKAESDHPNEVFARQLAQARSPVSPERAEQSAAGLRDRELADLKQARVKLQREFSEGQQNIQQRIASQRDAVTKTQVAQLEGELARLAQFPTEKLAPELRQNPGFQAMGFPESVSVERHGNLTTIRSKGKELRLTSAPDSGFEFQGSLRDRQVSGERRRVEGGWNEQSKVIDGPDHWATTVHTVKDAQGNVTRETTGRRGPVSIPGYHDVHLRKELVSADREVVRETGPPHQRSVTTELFDRDKRVFHSQEVTTRTKDGVERRTGTQENVGTWGGTRTWESTRTPDPQGGSREILTGTYTPTDAPKEKIDFQRTTDRLSDGTAVSLEKRKQAYYDEKGARVSSTTNLKEVRLPDGSRQSSSQTRTQLESESNGSPRLTVYQRKLQDDRLVEDSSESREQVKPELDLPGKDWTWWESPQSLVNRLGSDVKGEMVYSNGKHRNEKGQMVEHSMASERVFNRKGEEVLVHRTEGAGKLYEFRTAPRQLKDGETVQDSQLFFQGTRSTVITRHREENGWKVQHTHSDLKDLKQKSKGDHIQALSDQYLRTRDQGSLKDVESVLAGGGPASELSSVLKSQAFQGLKDSLQAGQQDGKLRITVMDSQQDANGDGLSVRKDARLLVETERGDQFVVAKDAQGRVVAHLQRGGQLAEGQMREQLSILDAQGRADEISLNDRGQALARMADGQVQNLQLNAAGTSLRSVPSVTDNINATVSALERANNAAKYGSRVLNAPATLRQEGVWKALTKDTPGITKLGNSVSGATAALNGFAMVSSLHEERYGQAVQELGQFSSDAGKTMVAVSGVTRSAPNALFRAGRAMGTAGGVIGIGVGISNIVEGDAVGGALDIAAGGSTVAAAFGSGSAAGPVGWAAAAVFTGLRAGWDYWGDTTVANLAF